MSDLKEKAMAAIAEVEEWKAAGEHWPQWNRRYLDFRYVAGPQVVLELLDEIESLRESNEQVCENYNRVSFASEERGKQINQLKADNEALRIYIENLGGDLSRFDK